MSAVPPAAAVETSAAMSGMPQAPPPWALPPSKPAACPAGAVHVGGPRLGGLLRALRQPGRDAADAGDVADGNGARRHARRGGATVTARRCLVAVGAARAAAGGGR